MFDKNTNYTRTDIQYLLGGGELQTYLPQKNKRILAGCFNYELNPNCPNEIQAGIRPKVKAKAELLMLQKDNIFPVFTKAYQRTRHYRFIGNYHLVNGTNSPEVLAEAEKRSGRFGQLSYVLNLEPVT